ncbi:MAG: hypothetical protein LBI18_07975 [Planctomycetaceae bacterium]|jgi:hypothetical protein|nr:hypothetical protein [Planctomycetaceae bacterium]
MLNYRYFNPFSNQHPGQPVRQVVRQHTNQHVPCRHRSLKRGLSTIVAMVVLVVVGSSVLLLSQTIIREQHHNVRKRQIIQADILVDDLLRIAEKRKQNISATISASVLRGVADFRITAAVEGDSVTATGKYVAEELAVDRQYSTQKQKQAQK